MVDSLRDQLLKSGIVKQLKDEKRQQQPAPRPHAPSAKGKPPHHKPPHQPKPARKEGEIDLAKAYAIRAHTEAEERKRAEQEAAEQARLKRERKAKVQKLLEGQILNKADGDQVRHFEYGGKIRRVYVDANQLADLNAGKLGIVQNAGRYLVVTQTVAEQVREIDSHLVALLVDPAAVGVDEEGIPDDLMW
ncbi:DUF2058 domain-containing protein [Dyella nitratireducens]|uniref:Nucleoprotein/polynucleotide-associated enzyme n=1 Tax=Dyella nitratireducens TaxID=1849580 RepID=A0ABQ1FKG6_9GAMM|nr:DUF2058 family protein [Dyella nitratireducens]GGA17465.1 hypothetical protein GCM10010981_01540 [Dyella nitratireducens]GLQ44785.1 hypothetical protein GCM10007902_46350 [Dyella nitratireducens]